MVSQSSSTPWQVQLCLEHGYRFQTQGDGKPVLYGLAFFAHINRVKDPKTVRTWSDKFSIRHKKIAEVMMTEEDFARAFEWINGTEAVEDEQ